MKSQGRKFKENSSENFRVKWLVLKFFLEMATAAQMYNEMNFENHLMNQAYLHPGNSLGKLPKSGFSGRLEVAILSEFLEI